MIELIINRQEGSKKVYEKDQLNNEPNLVLAK